ncbi:hypothetical protein MSPP1_002304 [Malassezia sp. CBS 17886]|nr:hypothetical protein MSPP1_002304 [Malassezia sp. CBS 17886]
MYPTVSLLVSSKQTTEATPGSSYSSSSRDSASPVSSPASFSTGPTDASPGGYPYCSKYDAGGIRHMQSESLYPSVPKFGLSPYDGYGAHHAHEARALGRSSAEDAQYLQGPPPVDHGVPHAHAPWDGGSNRWSGQKRQRSSVDEFWGDVRRAKIAPVYDLAMTDRLNAMLAPGQAVDGSLLNTFLGDSVEALGAYSTQSSESSFSYAQGHERDAGDYTAMQAQEPHSRDGPALGVRPTGGSLAEINAWLLQLGNSVARTPAWTSGPPHSAENACGETTAMLGDSLFGPGVTPGALNFAQSLQQLGLDQVAGVDTAPRVAPFSAENTSLMGQTMPYAPVDTGSQASAPADFSGARSARHDVLSTMQAHAMEKPVQHTYRHVEPLMRAPPERGVDVDRLTSSYRTQGAKLDGDESVMDEDEDTPVPSRKNSLADSDGTAHAGVACVNTDTADRERSAASSGHLSPISIGSEALRSSPEARLRAADLREQHLFVIMNLLLALNHGRRLEPGTGHVVALTTPVGDSERHRAASQTHLAPGRYTPKWRAETRDRSSPSLTLYDLNMLNASRRPSPVYRFPSHLSNTLPRARQAPAPQTASVPPRGDSESPLPTVTRTGALPSIAELFSDANIN